MDTMYSGSMKVRCCVCLAASRAKEGKKEEERDIRRKPEITNLNSRKNSIVSSCDEGGRARKLLEEEIGKC